MIGLFALSTASVAPLGTTAFAPCDGIRQIEVASINRPVAFANLREQGQRLAIVRNAAGVREERQVPVTNVKSINGFARCRFVYTSQIDLACYMGPTLPDTEVEAISERLLATAESVGHCLTNPALVRSSSEVGSTPSVMFGGGSTQPFWQISMVPTQEDPTRIQAEVLVLGPAQRPPQPQPVRRMPKAKRKSR
jgi:hypothetical protein